MQTYQHKALCRVRTITLFLSLTKDKLQWETALNAAKAEFDLLVPAIQTQGYHIQSIRIVTNSFGEYLDLTNIETAKQDLAYLKQLLTQLNDSGLRIRFAIGEAKTPHELALLPELILNYGDLSNACVNIEPDEFGILDNETILQSAQIIKQIAEITPRGEGNFNFTVNFNCKPFIPYFPASYHSSKLPNSFVIGLETPDLLVAVLKELKASPHNDFYRQCYETMSQALQYHVDEVLEAVKSVQHKLQFAFAGIDSSAAPSKNCASMTEVYELMGVPFFGQPEQ
ncbi:hypothetical protein Mh1957_03400 [Mannheimia haemolytica]